MHNRSLSDFIARLRRSMVVFAHDVFVIPVAWLGALWLRFNLGEIPADNWHTSLLALPIVMVVQAVFYQQFGLYRGVWRFASMPDLVRIVKAVGVGVLVSAIVLFFFNRLDHIPRSVFPLHVMLLVMLLGGARFFFRWQKDYGRLLKGQRVLIVGAGKSGESLVRDMLRAENDTYLPVAFLDDQVSRRGVELHGVRVAGTTAQLHQVVQQYNIDLVVIARPGISATQMRELVAATDEANVPCVTLPSLNDLATGRVSVAALREVSLEDLLGRDPVRLDWQRISESLANKTVLVTGGAGSIGSELCRQIAQLQPARLVVVDNNEYGMYRTELALSKAFPDVSIAYQLLDVTDVVGMKTIFADHAFDVVFHAAAYKHVPMLESQVRVATQNNVLGTWVVANAAVAAGVPKFVLISTDKAVHPVNIMGATKRAAEIICQNLNSHVDTAFVTVRFGNVLGSNGSVVPLFREQIASGGPVTVTHPEITRFFMTIPEATQLILQASVLGDGGEIFVLDMGEPIKIRYLAEQMIRLAGFEPGQDIDIQFTGLRPGEKLFEELFHQAEGLLPTAHQKILKAQVRLREWAELTALIAELGQASSQAREADILSALQRLVPDYQPATSKPTPALMVTV